MNNNKIDWVRKLTSRKFWVAVAAMVAGFIMAFGGAESDAQTVSGCIMSVAAVIGYLVGEGLTDAANTTPIETKTEKEDTDNA